MVFSLITSSRVEAIPSHTPHNHTDKTIQWEEDGTKDGSTSHNHRSAYSFLGFGDTGEPYSAFAVWDDRDFRTDFDAVFSSGHGFVDETAADAIANKIPRYFFSNASGVWPEAAKARIRDAFNAWGAVASDKSKWRTGIAFQETAQAVNAEITLLWENIDDASNCGGSFNFVARTQSFDSSLNWDFNQDPTGIAATQWHFYSVALHEIGHIVGLFHQVDTGDVMRPSVGVPTGGAGAGVPATCLGGALAGTFFMGIDPDSIEAVRDLYSIPTGLDLAFVIDTTGSMFDDIDAVKVAATDIVNTIDSKLDDYRIAVISYEDFPVSPYGAASCGDATFHDVLAFSTDKTAAVSGIQGLFLRCGADLPESVYSALMHAIDGTSLGGWRKETDVDDIKKAIVLMGDAPGHDPEPFTGFTSATVIAAAVAADPISIFPIAIGFDASAKAQFSILAEGTDGKLFTAPTAGEVVDAVIEAIGEIITPTNNPPNCTFAVADPSQIWPPNHKLVPISIMGVEDPDGDPVAITITSITQDEPVFGIGSGDTAPDGFGVGTESAKVRAERAGGGNSRVYQITFVAVDDKGAECAGAVITAVPHDQGANTLIVNDGQIYVSTGP